MRKLLFTALIVSTAILVSCSNYRTYSSEPIVMIFDDVMGDQETLYVKANQWMVSTFNDAESVIQFSDKATGTIIGKYLLGGTMVAATAYNSAADLRIYAIIDVRVKDNKARISVDPQEWSSYDENLYPRYAMTPDKVKAETETLIDAFYKHMIGSDIDF